MVDGVETRVVEEYETEDGELIEISRNYFAFCTETGSIFYFGEDVDIYEDGEIVSHDGAWLAGVDGAEAGRHHAGHRAPRLQVLPGDGARRGHGPRRAHGDGRHRRGRRRHLRGLPRGVGDDALAPDDLSIKVYAPGVGLVIDDVTELVEYSDPGDS